MVGEVGVRLRRANSATAPVSREANAGIAANEVMYQVIQPPQRWRPYRAGMWIVELSFSDAPERLAARPAHRERLTELHRAGVVCMAGPWADDSGALIVFNVRDDATLGRLLAADPYFATPGVQVTARREWHPFL
jgi:uncharacterized protein YciI